MVYWYNLAMAERYPRNPNTTCFMCGNNIYRKPCELKRNKGKAYCSQLCYGRSCRKEKPCVVCKKPILAGLNKITCSRACSNRHRAGIRYKIGRPKDKVKSQKALKTRLINQRGSICERRSYDRVQILQIHHIDRDRQNNALTNLELLCPNCHCEEHQLEDNKL